MNETRHYAHTGAPEPVGAYSQGVASAGLLFTAGFGPHDPQTMAVVGGDVATQTRQTLQNIARVLTAAGTDLSRVLKATVHLSDLERDFRDFDRTYREIMPAPFAARTTVGSHLLGILVEIDVIAELS